MAGLSSDGSLTTVTPDPEPEPTSQGAIVGRSPMRIAFDRLKHDKVAVVSFAIVVIFALIGIFAGTLAKLFGVSLETPQLACQLVDCISGTQMPKAGLPYHAFDPDHPFGMAPRDGQDLLANWLYGARTSLIIATVAAVFSTVVGVLVGLVAGYAGGWVDRVLSFITDIFLTLPFLLVALALTPILSQNFETRPELYAQVRFYAVIIILTVFGWMGVARIIRGEVFSLREREFVQAARVIGVPTYRILLKEILPNLVAPIVVTFSLGLPAYVTLEAGLSYLGIGVTGRPSWGQTIDSATRFFKEYPLFLWEPLLGIVILVVALNLLGDAIRDAVDPKTRR